jgi:hypothetical protein
MSVSGGEGEVADGFRDKMRGYILYLEIRSL